MSYGNKQYLQANPLNTGVTFNGLGNTNLITIQVPTLPVTLLPNGTKIRFQVVLTAKTFTSSTNPVNDIRITSAGIHGIINNLTFSTANNGVISHELEYPNKALLIMSLMQSDLAQIFSRSFQVEECWPGWANFEDAPPGRQFNNMKATRYALTSGTSKTFTVSLSLKTPMFASDTFPCDPTLIGRVFTLNLYLNDVNGVFFGNPNIGYVVNNVVFKTWAALGSPTAVNNAAVMISNAIEIRNNTLYTGLNSQNLIFSLTNVKWFILAFYDMADQDDGTKDRYKFKNVKIGRFPGLQLDFKVTRANISLIRQVYATTWLNTTSDFKYIAPNSSMLGLNSTMQSCIPIVPNPYGPGMSFDFSSELTTYIKYAGQDELLMKTFVAFERTTVVSNQQVSVRQ